MAWKFSLSPKMEINKVELIYYKRGGYGRWVEKGSSREKCMLESGGKPSLDSKVSEPYAEFGGRHIIAYLNEDDQKQAIELMIKFLRHKITSLEDQAKRYRWKVDELSDMQKEGK